jgi:sulfopyruvate decarboxylase subunit beta
MPSTTREYLERLAAARGEAIVVTTMTASKIWPTISSCDLDFDYLPSAMSHAADIALGIALAAPTRRVVCVNGDGSLVMNLGGLITAARSANFTMFVMQNGTYEVVGGGQVPGADHTDLCAVAAACGWPIVRRFADAAQFAAGLPEMLSAAGPVFATFAVADPPGMPLVLPARHPRDALRALRRVLSTT